MDTTTLLVKNMVCNRCVMAVEGILDQLNVSYLHVQLGEVHLNADLTEEQRQGFSEHLISLGFELIDTRISALVEKIKQLTIKRARNLLNEDESRMKLSSFLSATLHQEYSSLSSLFSSVEGRTIENFFIEHRIEYVKELLVYDELSLSEIALQLEYSSTAHLSAQFKKVTGLTPTYYKRLGAQKRKSLDQV